MLMSYVFRGAEIDIDITDRREPFEWLFFGLSDAERDALNATGDEENEIAVAIGEFLHDRATSDDGS